MERKKEKESECFRVEDCLVMVDLIHPGGATKDLQQRQEGQTKRIKVDEMEVKRGSD